MLKIILISFAVLIVVVLIVAATKPDTFSVQRSVSIKAAPDKVFALINDFKFWTGWSPWEKMDPAMKRIHSGADNGKGAVYAWEGNSKVGAGRMEILESTVPSKIVIKLDFIRPFEGHNIAEFSLQPSGEITNVTWVMHVPSNYIAKLMQVFASMDSLIGKDFEAGLNNMKILAEK